MAGRQLGDDAGGEHGDVALGAGRVGERGHRPAGVDDEHHGVLAGRHEALDERPAAACRRLPVEVLDVVAEHVLAEVVEVHAAALVDRPVLAVEDAAHLAMRMDRGLALTFRRENLSPAWMPEASPSSTDRASERADEVAYGVGITAKTASMMSSTRMPSATAWKPRCRRWRNTAWRSARRSSGSTNVRPLHQGVRPADLLEGDRPAWAGAELDVLGERRDR